MSLTEADQDWFEKELEPPTNKSSIIQCTLEGLIYLDEEYIYVSQINMCCGRQDFMFTLDYLPSRTSRSSESASLGSTTRRHLVSEVSNTSLDNIGVSDDSDDDHVQTWLKNELEDAKDWKPQPDLIQPPAPKLMHVKREGTIATLVTLPPSERKPKPSPRKRPSIYGPISSGGTPTRSKRQVKKHPTRSKMKMDEMEKVMSSLKLDESTVSLWEEKNEAMEKVERIEREREVDRLKYQSIQEEQSRKNQALQQQLQELENRYSIREKAMEEKLLRQLQGNFDK